MGTHPPSLPHGGSTMPHVPVLLAEIVACLKPRAGALYVDATFGRGGVASALLEAADCRVIAIDRDPDAFRAARSLTERHSLRFQFVHTRIGRLRAALLPLDVHRIDGGIVFDLGVSSPQLDDPERGFSFRTDGPLDMRMARTGKTAADIVNEADERALADILHAFGEERHARRIARAIVAARPFARTVALAEAVRSAVPGWKHVIDPATRTFQALRIAVNDELGELRAALRDAEQLLAEGSRLVVVSFHSLEDRIVKRFLAERSDRAPRSHRHAPEVGGRPEPTFRLPALRAVRPSRVELDRNPRARSARLRAAVRTAASVPEAA